MKLTRNYCEKMTTNKFNATLEEIADDLYNLKFPRREDLGRTFVRFEEHYENPEFQGRTFTLEEFQDWYVANSCQKRTGKKFDYFQYWDGFNIPSPALEPFYKGEFNPLSEHEEFLLDTFEEKRKQNFVVIGTDSKATSATLKHEKGHGLFYLNPEYRERVMKALKDLTDEDKAKLVRHLVDFEGYSPKGIDDEIHAYLLDRRYLGRMGITGESLKKVGDKLKKIYQEFVC